MTSVCLYVFVNSRILVKEIRVYQVDYYAAIQMR